jgi:hypothetical protein
MRLLGPYRDGARQRQAEAASGHRPVKRPACNFLCRRDVPPSAQNREARMTRGRATKWALWTGIPLVLIAAVVAFWNWDWFIPLVDARASAALGRSVSIEHLHLRLGRVTRVVADGVTISNPPNRDGPPFATAQQLVTDVDVWDDIVHHQLIIPLISLQ